jgi:glutamate-1-semialdehyde 2,1-aminomutase
VIVPWNDPRGDRPGDERARVRGDLAEPFPANMGLVPPVDSFLDVLRDAATENGALLVFDEVITGFRVGTAEPRSSWASRPT